MPHLALVNECDIYLFAQHVTVYPENGSCMSSPAPGSWWNPLNALVKHGITAEKRRFPLGEGAHKISSLSMGKKQGRSSCAKAGLTFYYISKGPLGLTNKIYRAFPFTSKRQRSSAFSHLSRYLLLLQKGFGDKIRLEK